MNNIKISSFVKRVTKLFLFASVFSMILFSCEDTFLEEAPISSLSAENLLTSSEGFEILIVGLHEMAREELSNGDIFPFYSGQQNGTDVVTRGQLAWSEFLNYETYLTPSSGAARAHWDWAYTGLITRANYIISNAERDDLKGIWKTEEQKNSIVAEAKFFRAYAYNLLANLYGGVPIVEEVYSGPKTDFVRNTREEVYEFASQDLEFAQQWLPETVSSAEEGRIVKGAANHLLTEVYNNLGQYDNAIASANQVINSGLYKLMDHRFGVSASEPGDSFSDLFKEGNISRSAGNLEVIYMWQFQEFTPGGSGTSTGNRLVRGWLPFWSQLTDPKGKLGMTMNDTIGRGVAIMRPTTYFLYEIWGEDFNNDMRNSKYNIRREFYYNNKSSAFFGQKVEPRTTEMDTMQRLYPVIRKVEGKPWQGSPTSGKTGKDFMVYRLAETYLLRAEAYLGKNDNVNAAKDINIVRSRAHASPVNPSDVDIDYILDERARELITEEPRRRTLMRMGKLVERVKAYNQEEETRNSISSKHELFPIPQTAIDANFSVELGQNPGY